MVNFYEWIIKILGVGYAGVNLFSCMVDLCRNLKTNTYYGPTENIGIAVKPVFDMVLNKAGNEESKRIKSKI